jgi:hypothetical protein
MEFLVEKENWRLQNIALKGSSRKAGRMGMVP